MHDGCLVKHSLWTGIGSSFYSGHPSDFGSCVLFSQVIFLFLWVYNSIDIFGMQSSVKIALTCFSWRMGSRDYSRETFVNSKELLTQVCCFPWRVRVSHCFYEANLFSLDIIPIHTLFIHMYIYNYYSINILLYTCFTINFRENRWIWGQQKLYCLKLDRALSVGQHKSMIFKTLNLYSVFTLVETILSYHFKILIKSLILKNLWLYKLTLRNRRFDVCLTPLSR